MASVGGVAQVPVLAGVDGLAAVGVGAYDAAGGYPLSPPLKESAVRGVVAPLGGAGPPGVADPVVPAPGEDQDDDGGGPRCGFPGLGVAGQPYSSRVTNSIGWIGALGSPVALAGLGAAVYELRAGRAERRDEEANQARLVTIEFTKTDNPLFFRFGVHNRSQHPIFDLELVRVGYIASRMDDAIVEQHLRASFLGNASSRTSAMDLRTVEQIPIEPVLGAGKGVWANFEWHDPDWRKLTPDPRDAESELRTLDYGITIDFLDTHGRRWQRTNTSASNTNTSTIQKKVVERLVAT